MRTFSFCGNTRSVVEIFIFCSVCCFFFVFSGSVIMRCEFECAGDSRDCCASQPEKTELSTIKRYLHNSLLREGGRSIKFRKSSIVNQLLGTLEDFLGPLLSFVCSVRPFFCLRRSAMKWAWNQKSGIENFSFLSKVLWPRPNLPSFSFCLSPTPSWMNVESWSWVDFADFSRRFYSLYLKLNGWCSGGNLMSFLIIITHLQSESGVERGKKTK